MTNLDQHTHRTDTRQLRRRLATGFADLASDLRQLAAEMPTKQQGEAVENVIAGCVEELRVIQQRVAAELRGLE